jgi:phosphopantothenoylcysteine decarboxylase/phosphopantothenate--cysteine ligase
MLITLNPKPANGITMLNWAYGPMPYDIAPASANTMAKMANGLCDNLLTAVYLSAKCPVYFAPAMDLDMWKHGHATKHSRLQFWQYFDTSRQRRTGQWLIWRRPHGRAGRDCIFLSADIKKKLPLVNQKYWLPRALLMRRLIRYVLLATIHRVKWVLPLADELASKWVQMLL